MAPPPRERVRDSEEIDNIQRMSTEPLVWTGWRVDGIRSARKFFSALPEILPLPVTLYFEGTTFASDVRALLASNAVEPSLQVPPGTIWPKPSVFHVLGTEQFLFQLVALADNHAESEVCDHLHAYKDGRGLLQWYDAFSGDPALLEPVHKGGSPSEFLSQTGSTICLLARKEESRIELGC